MMRTVRLSDSRLAAAIAGLVFVVLLAAVAVVGVAYGFGAFSTSKTVTATLPEAGPALGPGAEVEYRGVLVGKLGKLVREPHHALLTLDLTPSQLDHIPAGVTVRLVPRSVFGDLYVDLVPPSKITGHLQPGAVLAADTSTPAVELNQALDAGYQLLTAIQPAKLDETLTAIATALNGRGAKLGSLVSQLADYTAEIAPHTARFVHDIGLVGVVGHQISANSSNLFRIVDDAIALSSTIAKDQPMLRRVLNTGPVVASQTNALLASNRAHLRTLVHQLQPVIDVLNKHQLDLENTLLALQQFTSGAARALGHGPYLQVVVAPDPNGARGQPYTAAQCPRYPGLAGPNCGSRSAKRSARRAAETDAVIQALVDHAAGADSTDGRNPGAVDALKQRLAIVGVLLAPALRSASGLR
jgi:virulence factor Mce-like protein